MHGGPGHIARRLNRSAIAFACSTIWSVVAFAAASGGTVTAGSGSISQAGTTTTVTQGTGKLAIDWTSFSIQPGETVNFVQPGSGAIVLNRVTGGASSAILGSLNASGTVFILNPNGVLFGANAQVNVGGLVASTLGLSDADFLAGHYAFSGNSTASVVNQGTISVPAGGKIALIANTVSNTGTINAPQGGVLLAGAGNVTLTLVDGSPLSYTISQGAANALVANGGLIQADGGHVILTARGLDALSQAVVNSTGVIRARTVAGQQGTIELIGDPDTGTTQLSGLLDASAQQSGGTGGTVNVLGARVGLFDGAKVDVSGQAGGGVALIGGNSRGAGPQPDAAAAYVAPGATIDASAIGSGDGGKIVVWGTDSANVHGTLLASGGAQGGNGGSVETSGHTLDTDGITVGVAAGTTGGTGGLWLLDPYNVTISTGTQTGGSFSSNVWTPGASGSLVNISNIQNILNSGGNVTITTTGAGTQEGNIAINGSISKTAGGNATLTLIADGRITTNASSGGQRTISSTSGALNVSMTANATTSAAGTSGISLSYLNVSANGGNISATAGGAQSGTAPALQLQNSTWTTSGSGTISLTGTLPSNGNSQGVYLKSTTLTTATGAISINGTSGGIATVTGTNSNGASLFSTSNIGVDLAGSNTIQSTSGAITLTGTATGATSTWAGSGVTMSALDKLSTSGAVTINGTTSNPTSTTYRNQLSAVDIAGSTSNAATVTGGTVSITGTNTVVGGASSTSNSNAAVKLEGNVSVTATSGPITISGSNTGGDGVWGSSTGAVTMNAPAASSVSISAQSLDSVSGYSGFYIGSGTLTFSTAVPVSITSSTASSARDAFWNKGGLTVPGNLGIVTTGGAVTDNSTIGGYFHITGTTAIDSSGAGDTISLTNSGNAFTGALSLTGANTTLANSTALTLGTSNVSGTLSLSAPGIAQTGALTVSGTSTFNAGTSAITLSNAGNALSGAVALTGSNATLVNGAALGLAASTLTGALNLSAPGITQTGALSVGGTATLNAGSDAITLNNSSNLFSGTVALTAGDAALTSGAALSVGTSAMSGALSLSAPGITQSGALTVGGTTTLNAGSNTIALSNGGNLLYGTLSLTAGNATLVDSAALSLGASTTTGAISLSAPGISQSGALSVGGIATIDAGSNGIALGNTGNAFSGALGLTAGNATLASTSAVNLGTSALTGNFSLTAPGITQSGALLVDGATTLNAGTSAITLANGGNLLYGPVALTATNAALNDGTSVNLAASTLSGTLNIAAPGIAQSGALIVGGATTLSAGTSTIILNDNGNMLNGSVSVTAGDVTLNDNAALTFNTSNLSGNLNATAPGVSQTGALTITGSITVNAGSNKITLGNVGNLLYGPVALTAGNATLVDGTTLTLGTSSLSGNLNLTAAGIGQTGALTVNGTTTLDAGNSAITLADSSNAFTTLSVTGSAGAGITNANALTVTGLASNGDVNLTTMSGDLNTQGTWSITNGNLILSAGAASARGTTTGGDVKSADTFTIDSGKTVTVYSGSVASTVLGGTLAQRATAGSGDFRYDRQNGDAPGAASVGDGTTYVMYREQPTLTVTPTDSANTKMYDGSTGSDPQFAYGIAGQLNGDTAAQILTGSLARASGGSVGSYAISLGSLADQLGYQVVLSPGHTFGITPAPLVVTVNSTSRGAGQSNPAFGVTYSGFVGGDTAQSAGLQGTLSYSTNAGPSSPSGRYTVTADGQSSQNYSISYVAGTLTVLPVSASVGVPTTTSTTTSVPSLADTSYMAAIADVEAKARVAGAIDAPMPAQKTGDGWSTDAAAFWFGNAGSQTPPADLVAAPQ